MMRALTPAFVTSAGPCVNCRLCTLTWAVGLQPTKVCSHLTELLGFKFLPINGQLATPCKESLQSYPWLFGRFPSQASTVMFFGSDVCGSFLAGCGPLCGHSFSSRCLCGAPNKLFFPESLFQNKNGVPEIPIIMKVIAENLYNN